MYCATKAAVKALSDGLRIDLVDTPVRVTNIKPGLVETNFSVVRFRGDKAAADNVYKGIRPLTGDDIAEVVYFAAAVPRTYTSGGGAGDACQPGHRDNRQPKVNASPFYFPVCPDREVKRAFQA